MALELAESWPWKKFLKYPPVSWNMTSWEIPEPNGLMTPEGKWSPSCWSKPRCLGKRHDSSTVFVNWCIWFHGHGHIPEWEWSLSRLFHEKVSISDWWVVQWKRMTPNSQPTSKLVSNFLIYCLVVRNGPATCWFANQPCRGRRFRSRQQSHPAFAGPPNKQNQH